MRALLLVGLLCAVAPADEDTLIDLVHERIASLRTQFEVPSIVTAFVQGNTTLDIHGIGRANVLGGAQAGRRSTYAVASLTKPLTATALLRVLHLDSARGRGDLVKPLLQGVVHASSILDQITFEDVLSHKLLMVRDPPLGADDEYRLWEEAAPFHRLDQELAHWKVFKQNLPGYSNRAYLVAGYLLARLDGDVTDPARTVADYERAMDRYVFKHLKMRRTANSPTPRMVELLALPYDSFRLPFWPFPRFRPKPLKRFVPTSAGETYTTAWDLGLFLRAHIDAGPLAAIDEDEVAKPMRTSAGAAAAGVNMGLGWWVMPEGSLEFVYHNGDRDGYRSLIVFEPNHGAGLVFLTNGNCSLSILDDFRTIGVEVLSLLADEAVPLPVINTIDPPLPPPFPPPPPDLPSKTYVLVRGSDTTVAQYGPDGLRIALPGGLWALTEPKAGAQQTYTIAPFLGGAFRKVQGAPRAALDQSGLVWGSGMAPRPFTPTGQANLAAFQGTWGGTLAGDSQVQPVLLRVTGGTVRMTIDSDRLQLTPAKGPDGQLVGVAGSDLRTMVRVVLAAEASGDELVGTWQAGTHRCLLHLRRSERAGWDRSPDPRLWAGKWAGDVSRDLEWSGARITAASPSKMTLDFPALGLKGAEARDLRLAGHRVSFVAGDWRFQGRVAGSLFSGEAVGRSGVALFSLRRTGS